MSDNPGNSEILKDAIDLQRAMDRQYAERSSLYFLDRVMIRPSDPAPFGRIAEPWQREVAYPKCVALDQLCGLAPYRKADPRSFLTVLARGHDKSSLEGRLINYALRYSRKPINGVLCAADLDQAEIIIQAAEAEANLNPHLLDGLTYTRQGITGPAGIVRAVASDGKSAFGKQVNLIVADEITHWHKDDLWEAIVSGRHKVPESLLIVITNSGFLNSWQHGVRQEALAGEFKRKWVVFERPGNLAGWMSAEERAFTRTQLSEPAARRLLDNEWLDPSEEFDYLRRGDAELCVDPNWTGLPGYDRRHRFVVIGDYGPKKDRTALGVLHQGDGGIIWTDRLDVWQGSHEAPVQIADVDKWLDEMIARYRPVSVVLDEYQMEATIQRLTRLHPGLVQRFRFRGGQGNLEMAQDLRAAVINRRLRWGPGQGLLGAETVVDEIAALVTKITAYGYRFDHKSASHDDRAAVLGMGVLEAIKYPPAPSVVSVPEVLTIPRPTFGVSPLSGR